MVGRVEEIIQRNAPDIGAGATAAGFGMSLATANELIQLVAGVLAVIAGAFSVYWHIRRWRGEAQRRGKDHHETDEESG